MPQAAGQSNVLRYPTKRKRPFLSPYIRGDYPEGVVPIRQPTKPTSPFSRSPELALLLAIIGTMTAAQKAEVATTLHKQIGRHPDDPALAQAIYAAQWVL